MFVTGLFYPFKFTFRETLSVSSICTHCRELIWYFINTKQQMFTYGVHCTFWAKQSTEYACLFIITIELRIEFVEKQSRIRFYPNGVFNYLINVTEWHKVTHTYTRIQMPKQINVILASEMLHKRNNITLLLLASFGTWSGCDQFGISTWNECVIRSLLNQHLHFTLVTNTFAMSVTHISRTK